MPDDIQTLLRTCEGVVPHFYLDTRGLVTIGVGHMVPDPKSAAALPMLLPDGTPADYTDIRRDWMAVHMAPAGKMFMYYGAIADLRMDNNSIEALLDADIAAITRDLAPAFAAYNAQKVGPWIWWSHLPPAAQTALLSMAFALGPRHLVSEYPHLLADCAAGDWEACAQQCSMQGVQPARNRATAALFLSI